MFVLKNVGGWWDLDVAQHLFYSLVSDGHQYSVGVTLCQGDF